MKYWSNGWNLEPAETKNPRRGEDLKFVVFTINDLS